jgi:DNA polymerase (family 10)
MERFVHYPEVRVILAVGDTKSSMVLRNGLQVDLRVLEKKAFGAALQYFTGSKAHNIAIRDRAKRMGLKVSEYGVFREDNNERVAGEKEEDVYKVVGLPWIPPELRENRGEIEAAIDGRLPRLVELKDIKGDLHVHTKATDGGHSIEEMAEAAIARGYEYIAITDHSRAVGIAHGMDEKRLLKQMDEIDRINSRIKAQDPRFRILKGVEVDIKADGSLDLDEKVLSGLDVVVGAVHSKFNMEANEMTDRIISAMATGVVNIIAHPTGRIIGAREPYPVDMKTLMEAAKRYNVVMELNSYPDRLDLSDIHLRLAKDMGVMVVISTDSHGKLHYENIIFGIHTARRGWLEKKDILNTRPVKEMLELLKRQ